MQNNFYKEIEGVKLPEGIDKLYLSCFFEMNGKNIWNKKFYFSIEKKPCGSNEMSAILSYATYSEILKIAVREIEKAGDIFLNAKWLDIATIENGKITDLTKRI